MVNSEVSEKKTIGFSISAKKTVSNEMFFNELTKSYDEEDFTVASTFNNSSIKYILVLKLFIVFKIFSIFNL